MSHCHRPAGYAYSGGGARILRVDVSADRGRTWVEAAALAADAAPPGKHYSWTLWTATVPVSSDQKQVSITTLDITLASGAYYAIAPTFFLV